MNTEYSNLSDNNFVLGEIKESQSVSSNLTH